MAQKAAVLLSSQLLNHSMRSLLPATCDQCKWGSISNTTPVASVILYYVSIYNIILQYIISVFVYIYIHIDIEVSCLDWCIRRERCCMILSLITTCTTFKYQQSIVSTLLFEPSGRSSEGPLPYWAISACSSFAPWQKRSTRSSMLLSATWSYKAQLHMHKNMHLPRNWDQPALIQNGNFWSACAYKTSEHIGRKQ